MRPNTTTTRIFALVAAAACAVGLSACRPDVPVPEPTDGGGTATAAPSAGAVAGARDVEPITFNDEAIGLTETCSQIITDFKAPSYQKGDKADTTIYLLHCTLDYSGDLSYDVDTSGSLKLVDDKDELHYGHAWNESLIKDDMEAAGLKSINIVEDHGLNHVDGWVSFTVSGKDGKANPLPEGATTLTYERGSFTNKSTGKAYEAYSTRSKVTIR
ncbi:MAG: hypothetical protein ACFNME_02400 [Actinomyces dentalis]